MMMSVEQLLQLMAEEKEVLEENLLCVVHYKNISWRGIEAVDKSPELRHCPR
jgi:hypothetical protein